MFEIGDILIWPPDPYHNVDEYKILDIQPGRVNEAGVSAEILFEWVEPSGKSYSTWCYSIKELDMHISVYNIKVKGSLKPSRHMRKFFI